MTCDLCGQEVIGDLNAHYRYACNMKPARAVLRTRGGNQPETREEPKRLWTPGGNQPETRAEPKTLWTSADHQRRTRVEPYRLPDLQSPAQEPARGHEPSAREPARDPELEPLLGEERTRVPIPKEIKRQVWARDGGRCRNCGITNDDSMLRYGEYLHFDHIIPFSKNGADTVSNLQLLCGPCNRAKAAQYDG
jgi:5-methylcytosine-specific restriction endonuclease McrA